MKEQTTNDKVNEGKGEQFDLQLHQTILKQQELLLKQQELIALKKEEDDEIDLSALLPSFLKRKNTTSQSPQDENHALTQKDGLLEFLSKIKRPFVQNNKLISLFTLIGLLGGIFTYQTSEPVYTSELTLQNGGLDNSFFAGLITPLGKLTATKGYQGLASKLDMDTAQVKMIHSISYQNYLFPNENPEDTSFKMNNRPFFNIHVEVYNTDVLPELEQKVARYLLNNKYVQEEKRIKEENLQSSAQKLQQEAVLMDSIRYAVVDKIKNKSKDNAYFVRKSSLGGGIILSQNEPLEVDPLAAYDKSMQIFRQEQSIRKQTSQVNNLLNVVDGFVAYNETSKTTKHKIPLFAILGFILGTVAAFLLSGFNHYRKASQVS